MPLIELTSLKFEQHGKPDLIKSSVLLSTEHMIRIKKADLFNGKVYTSVTKIESVGGITTYVAQSMEVIYQLSKNV